MIRHNYILARRRKRKEEGEEKDPSGPNRSSTTHTYRTTT
jgi:hypothetical protein